MYTMDCRIEINCILFKLTQIIQLIMVSSLICQWQKIPNSLIKGLETLEVDIEVERVLLSVILPSNFGRVQLEAGVVCSCNFFSTNSKRIVQSEVIGLVRILLYWSQHCN